MSTQDILMNQTMCEDGETVLRCRLKQVIEAGPEAIEERLAQLDHEWTTGRAAAATAGVVIIAGLILALLVSPWWLILTGIGGITMLAYLFTHRTLVGSLYHALGFRSRCEIDQERLALKALRGDFCNLPSVHQIEDADSITRLEGEGGMVVEPEEPKHTPDEAIHDVLNASRR
jgi:hypothetical protein